MAVTTSSLHAFRTPRPKLRNDNQKGPAEAFKESLEKLQLDYVDLYLMHWPVPAIDHYVEAWKGMIELQQQGLIKSIGVCNFQTHHLQKLIDETSVIPVINQIELHPLLQQRQGFCHIYPPDRE